MVSEGQFYERVRTGRGPVRTDGNKKAGWQQSLASRTTKSHKIEDVDQLNLSANQHPFIFGSYFRCFLSHIKDKGDIEPSPVSPSPVSHQRVTGTVPLTALISIHLYVLILYFRYCIISLSDKQYLYRDILCTLLCHDGAMLPPETGSF